MVIVPNSVHDDFRAVDAVALASAISSASVGFAGAGVALYSAPIKEPGSPPRRRSLGDQSRFLACPGRRKSVALSFFICNYIGAATGSPSPELAIDCNCEYRG